MILIKSFISMVHITMTMTYITLIMCYADGSAAGEWPTCAVSFRVWADCLSRTPRPWLTCKVESLTCCWASENNWAVAEQFSSSGCSISVVLKLLLNTNLITLSWWLSKKHVGLITRVPRQESLVLQASSEKLRCSSLHKKGELRSVGLQFLGNLSSLKKVSIPLHFLHIVLQFNFKCRKCTFFPSI